jgi:hypothetical protein
MGRAGQNTFSGISAQADVALYYLLQGSKRNDFVEIIIEDENWEDFTLVYRDHVEVFEVKWYRRNVSHSMIHGILKKKRLKGLQEKDKIRIVVRALSPKFRDDFTYATKYGFWWMNYPEFRKYLRRDRVHRRLMRDGWTSEQLSLLRSATIVEFYSKPFLVSKIEEFFVLDYPIYLDRQDQQSVIALTFRRIMEEGTRGGRITREEFVSALNDFIDHITNVPTRISPTLALGKRIIRLSRFLRSERRLRELNHKTYLTQISSNTRLLYYVYHKLLESSFNPRSFDFFFQGVLIKRNYSFLAMHLLKTRWEKRNVDPEYLVATIVRDFGKLQDTLAMDDALTLLEQIVKEGLDPEYDKRILAFLKKHFLSPFSGKKVPMTNWLGNRHQMQPVANMLLIIHQKTGASKVLIDFIFTYFDLTGDDVPLVMETHPSIYGALLSFLHADPTVNFEYVTAKLGQQFNVRYGGKYRGFEWSGTSYSQSGGSFKISDIGAVRLLFRPFFDQFYEQNPKAAWAFIKKRVLMRHPRGASSDTPVFLKRAVVPLLIRQVSDKQIEIHERNQSMRFLCNIVSIPKGFPSTSSILFAELSETDLGSFGYENAMKLVELDSRSTVKGLGAAYPTNVFVIITLLRLAKVGYDPAKTFMVELVRKRDYLQLDRQYKTINLLSYESVGESEPDFVLDLLEALDIESYLNIEASKNRSFMLRTDFLEDLIKKDWVSGSKRGDRIIHQLLKRDFPSAAALEFVTAPIQNLSKQNALKTYLTFEEYLQTKDLFRQKFKNSVYAREHFVWLAEGLAKKGYYTEAQKLVDFNVDDPDPITDDPQSATNHHFAVIQGEEAFAITSVR